MQNLNVFSSEKSVTQLWFKQYSVDSTLTQMTIGMIRLWLDSYPWFSRPTQLWLDSFESESSQIWLTTHESSTTLIGTLHCHFPSATLCIFLHLRKMDRKLWTLTAFDKFSQGGADIKDCSRSSILFNRLRVLLRRINFEKIKRKGNKNVNQLLVNFFQSWDIFFTKSHSNPIGVLYHPKLAYYPTLVNFHYFHCHVI